MRPESSVFIGTNIWTMGIHVCCCSESPHWVICYYKHPPPAPVEERQEVFQGWMGKVPPVCPGPPPVWTEDAFSPGWRDWVLPGRGCQYFAHSFVLVRVHTGTKPPGQLTQLQQLLVKKRLHLLTTPHLPVRHFPTFSPSASLFLQRSHVLLYIPS